MCCLTSGKSSDVAGRVLLRRAISLTFLPLFCFSDCFFSFIVHFILPFCCFHSFISCSLSLPHYHIIFHCFDFVHSSQFVFRRPTAVRVGDRSTFCSFCFGFFCGFFSPPWVIPFCLCIYFPFSTQFVIIPPVFLFCRA